MHGHGESLAPFGLSPRQIAARAMWARRRETYGPSGFSPAGLREMTRHLIGQNDRRRKLPSQRRCRRGHRYADPVARRCNQCVRLRYHREKRKASQAWLVARARRRMIVTGNRSSLDPSNEYLKRCAIKARERWQQLKKAA